MSSFDKIPPQLVVIEGRDKGKVIPLKNGTVVLGRSKGDVIIQDSRISRSHVEVTYDENSGKLTFKDLESLNGTSVNGSTSRSGELQDGDKLQVGNTVLDCQIGVAHEPTVLIPKEPRLEPTSTATKNEVKDEKPTKVKTPASPGSTREHRLPPLSLPEIRHSVLSMKPRVRLALLTGAVIFGWYFLNGTSSTPTSTPEALERDIAAVRQLESKGLYSEAIAKAETIRKEHPEEPDAYLALGDLYFGIQKMEPAIENLKKAHSLDPKSKWVPFKLIKAYLKAGMLSLAQEEMRTIDRMIQEDPKDRDLLIQTAQLIMSHKELGQPVDKVLIIARALQMDVAPQSPIGYKLEAQQRMQSNQPEQALESLEKALKLNPSDEELFESIALAKLSLKNPAAATATVEDWLKVNPNAVRALLVLSYLKFNEKNFLGALPHLQRIQQLLATNPKEPYYSESLHLSGLIFNEQGQKVEAETFLNKACQLGYQQSCNHPILTSAVAPTPPAEATTPPNQ